MWLYVIQLALGLASIGVTAMMRRPGRLGPWLLILVQIPFTVYDLWFPATRGFTVLAVVAVATGIRMLRRTRGDGTASAESTPGQVPSQPPLPARTPRRPG